MTYYILLGYASPEMAYYIPKVYTNLLPLPGTEFSTVARQERYLRTYGERSVIDPRIAAQQITVLHDYYCIAVRPPAGATTRRDLRPRRAKRFNDPLKGLSASARRRVGARTAITTASTRSNDVTAPRAVITFGARRRGVASFSGDRRPARYRPDNRSGPDPRQRDGLEDPSSLVRGSSRPLACANGVSLVRSDRPPITASRGRCRKPKLFFGLFFNCRRGVDGALAHIVRLDGEWRACRAIALSLSDFRDRLHNTLAPRARRSALDSYLVSENAVRRKQKYRLPTIRKTSLIGGDSPES
ncbi:hypothetical protein EVAR_85844_1 [Eumeta japonica]|uniref:Uncharacterized protein n=1 Tax=Eumeta variegata TaxID=151549 RepID=A0A4C1UQD3_EUMVA|nr:hypothetical protein EVAR_85844_1 [Eumeta japonica]